MALVPVAKMPASIQRWIRLAAMASMSCTTAMPAHCSVICGTDRSTNINSKEIYPSSELLIKLSGQPAQVNKAVVGRNAFAHEAGIHQDGVLKDRRTYEIMRAEDVGAPWNPLVLGKHSGRHAVQKRCADLGFALEGEALIDVYRALMTIADDRKTISDDDIREAVAIARKSVPVTH